MTVVIGLRRSWLQDAVPWQNEAAVVSYTRPFSNADSERHLVRNVSFFLRDQFPHHTHVELRLAVALVELHDNALLRTRQTAKSTWSIFTPIAGIHGSGPRQMDPFYVREAIAQRVSLEMTGWFGDLVPLFNANMLHKALPLNEKQTFLYNRRYGDVLWLSCWILVNRELVCPEPIYQAVEWMTASKLLASVEQDLGQYHALTQTHLSCPVIER